MSAVPQMTSDGFAAYPPAAVGGQRLGRASEFAQVVKNYRSGGRDETITATSHPAGLTSFRSALSSVLPTWTRLQRRTSSASTGRQGASFSHMRRLSYAFSKTLAGHKAAMALHYTHYNWCHVVRTLRVTPAMQAGLTDHVWDLGELMAALLAAPPCEAAREGASREHPTPATASRALPNGRGFLSLWGATAGHPGGADYPACAHARRGASCRGSVGGTFTAELDLFAWRPREPKGQLDLFAPDGEGGE